MADGVRFLDHSPAVRARILAEINRRLDRSAIKVVNHAKEKISTPGPPASSPGDPIHKRSNRVRGSVTWEPGPGMTRRIGTNVFYARIHELGLHGFPARPWLRPALLEKAQEVEAILGAPIV